MSKENFNNKAVFLDRDGVLNKVILKNGRPYPPSNILELKLCEGVKEGLYKIKSKGYLLIGVTNQPDVSRGKTTKEMVEEINNSLLRSLPLDDIKTCFHDDVDQCFCRKPKPGMIMESAIHKNIDLSKSYIIGDRKKDIDAGKNAGCKTIFIDYNYEEEKPQGYDLKVESVLMASKFI
jgi:D-glycero-D-manno-heptose 1,7-bisphosphate phosphatase